MFPNIELNKIEEIMRVKESWEETVDLLTNAVERSSGRALIKTYIVKNLLDSKEIKIKINSQELWRDAFNKIFDIIKTESSEHVSS